MRRLTSLLLCLRALALCAGGDNTPVGPRIAGMGQAGVTLIDLWSVHHNQAGLAGLTKITVGAHYQRHFLSEELSQQGLAVAIPLGKGTIAVSGNSLGFDLYRETKAGVAYAVRFGEGLRAGVQLNYFNVRLGENYGSRSMMTAELGIQARLTEKLWLGAHLYNPTRAELGGPHDKGAYHPEVAKDIDKQEQFHSGIEYRPINALFLRTGVSTGPVQGHFGAGVRVKNFDIDLAVAYRSLLGPTPMIGLNYRFE
ncbi:MAG: hypothetical protein IPH53_00505 [Flavobacteriales bacterium]|nr:hypothetical protein [Flavobacteriales bacterium]